MVTLRIYDLDPQGVLAAGLRHLLDLLAPLSLRAEWRVSAVKSSGRDLFEATGKSGARLEALAGSGATVSGTALKELAHTTRQIVWGEFTATLPDADPWVTIRFIDSTWCEVATDDRAVLDAVRATWRDVR